jgi:hypothetical protein
VRLLPVLLALAAMGRLGGQPAPRLDGPLWLQQEGLTIAGSWESIAYRHRANGQVDQLLEKLRKE